MSLPADIRNRLTLPAICAPMYGVTGPALVLEACKAGLVGGLPAGNTASLDELDAWLGRIGEGVAAHRDAAPKVRTGPVAVNLPTKISSVELRGYLGVLRRHGVDLVITASGDPSETAKAVHDWGGRIFHDVVNLRFAEKAISAGVDGLICVGAGGGGHSGTISHLALIPRLRAMFCGTLVLAGAVSTGSAIRAGEVLGADLVYLGTRFIATREAAAPLAYKQMLVTAGWDDLLYTPRITGISANWLAASIRMAGLDPAALPPPLERGSTRKHLPPGAIPWINVWSGGQGAALIEDIPTVADLVLRLRAEYLAACAIPDMRDAAHIGNS